MVVNSAHIKHPKFVFPELFPLNRVKLLNIQGIGNHFNLFWIDAQATNPTFCLIHHHNDFISQPTHFLLISYPLVIGRQQLAKESICMF